MSQAISLRGNNYCLDCATIGEPVEVLGKFICWDCGEDK